MKVSKAIKLYLKDVESRCKPKTLRSYSGRLKELLEMYGKLKLKRLTPKKVFKWLEKSTHFLDGSLKAPDTIRLTMCTFQQMEKFLIEQGHLEEPICDIGKKPGGRKRTRLPTKMEQAQIFRQALRSGRKQFATIFRCLRLCGARPGELCAANIEDYEADQGLITLAEHKTEGKTGEPRLIGVGSIMSRLMDKEIGGRTEGPIFRDENQNRWNPAKLSRIYREIKVRLGFHKELVLYCARHEHGTIVCQKHGIHAAQHSLGHRDIQTTQRYVHPDPAHLAGYQDSL